MSTFHKNPQVWIKHNIGKRGHEILGELFMLIVNVRWVAVLGKETVWNFSSNTFDLPKDLFITSLNHVFILIEGAKFLRDLHIEQSFEESHPGIQRAGLSKFGRNY